MGKPKIPAKPKQTPIDVEINAIRAILAAFATLSTTDDRNRVLEYVTARVEDPEPWSI